ncbi:MAG: hypothetical protein K8T89_22890 [Planctomycetes bacterium]|nr:hypothetical protein [Planctomycetota bacterium]
MGRPRNATPSLCYHKTLGQWYYFANKKMHYLGRDKAEAVRRYSAVVEGGIDPGPPPVDEPSTDQLTVDDVLTKYVLHAYKHHTDKRSLARIDRAVEAAIDVHGETPAEEFRAKALRDVRDHLLREDPPLSRHYLNHLTKALKTAFAWLASEELVSAATHDSLRKLKALVDGEGGAELEDIPPVEDSAVEATLPFCHAVLRDMIRVQRLLGCRPGELVRMKRSEISTSESEPIQIPKTSRKVSGANIDGLPVWLYVPSKHKTQSKGKIRVVGIGPEAQPVLMPYLDRKPDEYLFRPKDAVAKHIATASRSSKPFGDCYTSCSYARSIWYSIRKARRARAKKFGVVSLEWVVPDWAPNQLRKAASENAASMTDAESAAAMLGHSASKRATDSYVQVVLQRIMETARKVG